jgi:hypothetical protein
MEALEELSVLNAIKTSPEALEELEKLEKLKVLNIMWNPADGISDQETMKRSLIKSFCRLGENNLRSIYIEGSDRCCMNCMAESWCHPPKHVRRFCMEGLVPLFSRGLLRCLRGTSSSSTPKYFEPLIFRDGILVQTGIVLDFPSPPVGSVPIKK